LNGARAKSSREVHPGDELAIRFGDRILTARVIEVPAKPPSKAMASNLYTIVSDEALPLV